MAVVSCSSTGSKALNIDHLDLEIVRLESSNALIEAASTGSVPGLKKALTGGDKINTITPNGTAFSLSLKNKHYLISQFLLKAGAIPLFGFTDGEPSALMLAAEVAQNDLVKRLIVKGAKVDYIDRDGYTAIAHAAINRHLTTMKILIAAGCDVNAIPNGKSILMYVVEDNNTLLVQQLIAAGADVNFRDESGNTALRLARRKGYFDLDLMLVQAGGRL